MQESVKRWRRVGCGRAPAAVCDAWDVADPDASGGPIPVTGVSEVVLEVLDLDRALRFYFEVLGLPVISRREDGERAWLMAGTRTRIGLWRQQVGIAGGRGGVHVHYAFHLDDGAYDAALARLRRFGYEPEEHSFDDQGRAAYVDDPDGNVVELWTWDVAGHLAP
jgi:catechol-2,3-dioxygenase